MIFDLLFWPIFWGVAAGSFAGVLGAMAVGAAVCRAWFNLASLD